MNIDLSLLVCAVGAALLWYIRRVARLPEHRAAGLLAINTLVIVFLLGIYTYLLIVAISAALYHYHRFWQNPNVKPLTKTLFGSAIMVVLVAGFPLFNHDRSWHLVGDWQLFLAKIGSSYVLFKAISYMLDTMQGKIPRADWLSTANYLLFFPTYANGPMYRYKEFSRQLAGALVVRRHMAAYKILLGIVKIMLISQTLQPFISYQAIDLGLPVYARFVLSLLVYYGYLYANFSGFCDIAIGGGALLGFRVPENFRYPFLAKDIGDFWRRWHITLSRVLFDSIFAPFCTLLQRGCKRYCPKLSHAYARLITSCIGYVVTFLISGLWHGSEKHFLVWGLWHALGLSVRRIYKFMVPIDEYRKGFSDAMQRRYEYASWLLTFVFITLGWAFFAYELDTVWAVLGGNG